MFKMLVQARRLAGLTDAQFYPRWQNQHGDLVRSVAQAMGFVRYIQGHRVASAEIDGFAAGRGWSAAPDGQAELWWESEAGMNAALSSPSGQAASRLLEIDEQAFTATKDLSAFVAIEETIFDFAPEKTAGRDPHIVKMVVNVWKKPGFSNAAFDERWRGAHAGLVRELAGAMGFIRYVQNHRDFNSALNFARDRGWQEAPDGVTEVWWDNVAAMREALASPAAAQASKLLEADERVFVDPTRTTAYLGVEKCIFDYTRVAA